MIIKKGTKNFIFLTVKCAVIALLIVIIPFIYINYFYLVEGQPTYGEDAIYNPASGDMNNIELPGDAKQMGVTPDQKYYLYMMDGEMHVNKTDDNEPIKIISEKNPIIYSVPMDDRNIILYFTYDSGAGVIGMHSYNIDQDIIMQQASMNTKNFSGIKQVEYSSLTNLIYVNVKVMKNNTEQNLIYKINIMKRVSQYSSGKIVKSMALLNGAETIYFQDKDNNILRNNVKLNLIKDEKEGFNLLGVDADDNVYIQSIQELHTIYKIKDNAIINKISLKNPDFIGVYPDKDGVYLLYKDHIINIANRDEPAAVIHEGNDFIGVFGGFMYLKTPENKIEAINLKLGH